MRIFPELTQDREFQELGSLGHTGSLNDRQFSALRSQGFIGSLTDMFGQYSGFYPASLFLDDEAGAWYDPSDLSTLFQDSAGITPVTTDGQSVGLVLDKSQQSSFNTRRNLLTKTEDFDNAVWVKSRASVTTNAAVAPDGTDTAEKLVEDATAANDHRVFQTASSVNSAYTASIYMKAAERTFGYIRIDDNTATGRYVWFNLSAGTVGTVQSGMTGSIVSAGNGWYRCIATVSNANLGINNFLVGTTTADNVSAYNGDGVSGILIWGAQFELGSTATDYQAVSATLPDEWLGNHLIQSTAGSRPLYGFHPATGVRNLLTPSQPPATASGQWALVNNATVSTSGEEVTITATGTSEVGWRTFQSLSINTQYTITIDASYVSSRYAFIRNIASGHNAWFDLLNGVVATVSAGATAAMLDLGDGFYRCSITSTTGGTITNNLVDFRQGSVDGSVITSVVGQSTVFRRGQIELGSTATAYQKVNTANGVTEAGVPTVHFLKFDGTDDFLVSAANLNPGSVDKVQIFAGVTKSSDAAQGNLIEHSASIGSNNGGFRITAPDTASNNYTFRSKGTTIGAVTIPGFAAPVTSVLSAIGDISGDATRLGVDGTAFTDATDQGTGNYLAYPIYVGRRGGISLPFNGSIYSLIVRFSAANLDAAVIDKAEAWTAGKTGVTL